jgi:hypothetical protein
MLTEDEIAKRKKGDFLDLSGTDLTTLEDVPFPEGIEQLDVSRTRITSLKGTPAGVRSLHCNGCAISSLEGVPDSLECLYCRNSGLTTFDGHHGGVYLIICGGSLKLTSFRGLKSGLKAMICVDCKGLTTWEGLPLDTLETVDYRNCNGLPPFPEDDVPHHIEVVP